MRFSIAVAVVLPRVNNTDETTTSSSTTTTETANIQIQQNNTVTEEQNPETVRPDLRAGI